MEEILQLTVGGKFNGRDARLSIGLQAESAFEIEDLSTEQAEESQQTQETTPEQSEEDQESPEPPQADAQVATEPTGAKPVQTDEPPEPATGAITEDEETGLDELFPDNDFDVDELPPFSADTKQYVVAKVVAEADGDALRVRTLTDQLQEEHGEEEWNDSKVTSHLYSIMDKGIVDREKHDASGKWQYYITDLGEASIEYAEQKYEEQES